MPRTAALIVGLMLGAPQLLAQSDADLSKPDSAAPTPQVTGPPSDPWSSPDIVAPRMDARPLQHGPEKGHTPAHVTPTAPAASSVWRTTAALGAVVALILLLAWGYRAVASGGRLALSNRKPGLIEVLSRTALSPRQSLCLVRIGPRLVLLGVTPESVRALDVIPDADVAAQLTGQAAARRADSSSAEFARCLEQQSRAYAAEVPVDDAPTPEDDRLAELKQRLSDTIARLRATAAQPEPGRTCPAGREVA